MPKTADNPGASAASGMVLMLLAVAIVPVGDTLLKLLSGVMSPFELAFWRYVFQEVFLLVAMLLFRQDFTPRHILLLLLGGLTVATTLVALIAAFAVMPIATAIAIFFVEPLILTVLSVIFLQERAGWRRYLAVAVGMTGVLIVIRPNWAAFGWQAILPLLAALAFASNMIIVRRVSRDMTTLAIQFWFTLFAVLLLGCGVLAANFAGVLDWKAAELSAGTWGLLGAMGVLSAGTFLLFSEAFRRTEASILAPLQYIEILGATVLGYVVFGDFPDAVTWLGTAIILLSGIYVFRRERLANTQRPAATAVVKT